MKKILAIVATLIISLSASADDERMIAYSNLPIQARSFVQKYFTVSDVARVERERDGLHYDYQVYLKNASEIEFDHHGNLQSIDCKRNAVPEGIVPALIVSFVQTHYPNDVVVEYAINYRSLKTELSNGMELVFDHEGHFIRIDD